MNREIIISNIEKILFDRLKFEADREGTDIKTYVKKLIKKSLGLEKVTDENIKYHDLDSLAGTWSNDDFQDFIANTEKFNSIDKELWK